MSNNDYLDFYRQTLNDIEDVVETAITEQDAEVDYESGNDMLTLTFSDGSVAIISRQSAVEQLWLAARSGGFHFDYDRDGADWVCTMNGRNLADMLEDVCREQGGLTLHFIV